MVTFSGLFVILDCNKIINNMSTKELFERAITFGDVMKAYTGCTDFRTESCKDFIDWMDLGYLLDLPEDEQESPEAVADFIAEYFDYPVASSMKITEIDDLPTAEFTVGEHRIMLDLSDEEL